MTDPTAAAREEAREIAHRRNTRCLGGARHTDSCNDAAEEILAALIAAEQRGREAAVPAGWRLVPAEPTSELLGKLDAVSATPVAGYWQRVYDALLAAAPQPKEPPRFSEVRFTQNGNATSKESDNE